MKIRRVKQNNRRKAFEVRTRSKILYYPYSRLELKPELGNRVADAYVDKELGGEGSPMFSSPEMKEPFT